MILSALCDIEGFQGGAGGTTNPRMEGLLQHYKAAHRPTLQLIRQSLRYYGGCSGGMSHD